MAPPQRVRVLRCYSCRLFQADQVKKSLKWTCRACGEKQSFLRDPVQNENVLLVQKAGKWAPCSKSRKKFLIKAYGEGSGADCRRHVQKLNLLQGQVSELSLRSLEESVNAKEGEDAGYQQAENARSQPSENRWLKYLEKDSKELEPAEGGVYSNIQPSPQKEEPDPPFSKHLPRKRKWGLSRIHPPGSPDAGDSGTREGSSKVTLQPQEGYSGLTARVKGESSGCLQNSEHWKSPSPAQEVKLPSSKWERFLVSPADTELPRPLQTGPRPASPGGHPSRPPEVLQLPQTTRAPPPGPKRPWPCRKTTKPSGGPGTIQAEGGHSVDVEEKAPPMLLCDLFSTGEDFDDDL